MRIAWPLPGREGTHSPIPISPEWGGQYSDSGWSSSQGGCFEPRWVLGSGYQQEQRVPMRGPSRLMEVSGEAPAEGGRYRGGWATQRPEAAVSFTVRAIPPYPAEQCDPTYNLENVFYSKCAAVEEGEERQGTSQATAVVQGLPRVPPASLRAWEQPAHLHRAKLPACKNVNPKLQQCLGAQLWGDNILVGSSLHSLWSSTG